MLPINECGTEYPRVLIVVKSQINDVDSTGMSLRNWFHGWPKNSIAQIYSGVPGKGAEMIGCSFQLGIDERRLGRLFFGLKRSALGQSASPYGMSESRAGASRGVLRRIYSALSRRIGQVLIESGLWELLFPPRISAELGAWIEQFKPDVIFAQGCDISFMRLPVLIAKERKIPICFDVVDDWVATLYRRSILSPLVRPAVSESFRKMLECSPLCYAIGPTMSKEYAMRYGVEFKVLMQCADQSRYPSEATRHELHWRTVRVIYSGSLALDRWRGIVELSNAALALSRRGLMLTIDVYAPYVPPEAASLEGCFAVALHKSVPDSEMPQLLASADILFLPESFDGAIRSYTKLSVSTKAHLYMMSGRVALVYGPPEIGTVEYAKISGWGYVVDEQSVEALAEAVERIANEPELRASLTERARQTVEKNHSDAVVREQLRRDLLSVVMKGASSV